MKRLLTLALLVFTTHLAYGQDFDVPTNYVLDSASDYKDYEPTVVACFQWLMTSPCNEDLVKRKAVGKFLNDWIEGAPHITVNINPDVVTYMDSSPELLLIFMGGWVEHVITTGDDSQYSGSLAGTMAVLSYYTSNKDYLRTDNHIDVLLSKQRKGKLEKFIRCSVK